MTPIKVGDTLPPASFFVMGYNGPERIASELIFRGKIVVLFAVPGAYTPTCHRYHLPGYLEHLASLKAKGIDDVAVLAVNDPYVMGAWAEATSGKGKIRFLSDYLAEFTKAIGMEFDGSDVGLGLRSKRYSMVVEDGVVIKLHLEDVPNRVTVSGVAAILADL